MIYKILRRKKESFYRPGALHFCITFVFFAKSFLISAVSAAKRGSALFSFCGLLIQAVLHKIDPMTEKATNFNFNKIYKML